MNGSAFAAPARAASSVARRVALAAAWLGLCLLPACSGETAPVPAPPGASAPAAERMALPMAAQPAPPARTPMAGGPRVLLGRVDGDSVRWELVDPAGDHVTPLGRSGGEAELLAVDDAAGEFLLRHESRIERRSWRTPSLAPVDMAPLPPVLGLLYATWLDRDSGQLRALEMRDPTPAEGRRMKPEPPDAQPVWALLWRWQQDRWQSSRRATSWAVDGAPGPAVFDDERRERGRSRRTIDESGRCDETRCLDAAAPQGVQPTPPAAAWQHLAAPAEAVVFGVAQADTLHVVGPFIHVAAGAVRVLPIPVGRSETFRLQVRGGWMLVAPGSAPNAAHLLDLQRGQVRALGRVVASPVFVE